MTAAGRPPIPDLQALVECHGSFSAIPPEAWEQWDAEVEACRERVRQGTLTEPPPAASPPPEPAKQERRSAPEPRVEPGELARPFATEVPTFCAVCQRPAVWLGYAPLGKSLNPCGPVIWLCDSPACHQRAPEHYFAAEEAR
jgi:hypothetical protein